MLITQIIAELKNWLIQLPVIYFDDCIPCVLTIKGWIDQFMCDNRQSCQSGPDVSSTITNKNILWESDTKYWQIFIVMVNTLCKMWTIKATIMYAKWLWDAKMKTADQRVTVPLTPWVGDAKTVTSSEFPTFWGTNLECGKTIRKECFAQLFDLK